MAQIGEPIKEIEVTPEPLPEEQPLPETEPVHEPAPAPERELIPA